MQSNKCRKRYSRNWGGPCGAHVFEGFFGLEHEPVKSVKMHDFNPKCEDALGESSKTNSRTLKTAGEAQRYDLHFLVSPVKRHKIVTLERVLEYYEENFS